jgi:GAF domain-containing protein
MGADQMTIATDGILTAFQTLLVSTPKVEDFLAEVAGLAANVVVPPASCGITTHYNGMPRTIATSDQRAALADEEQYGHGEGPCLESMDTGQVVAVDDQSSDQRWPAYRTAALDLGVQCSLSYPLSVQGESVGALNLYGFDRPHGFTEDDRRRAAGFASQAASAMAVAIRFSRTAETASQLEQALHSRSVIDQAIGVLMGQQRCDAEAAFALLRTHSQNNNRKLRDVAADIISRITGKPPIDSRAFGPSSEGSLSEDS